MENATKALLISGGILIAMLVISIGIVLFSNYRDVGSSYQQQLSATQIQKFNANFTKFEGRNDIIIQEIVSLANFVKDYNTDNEGKEIEVILQGNDLTAPGVDLIYKLKNDTGNYNAKIDEYDNDGLVKKITFYK